MLNRQPNDAELSAGAEFLRAARESPGIADAGKWQYGYGSIDEASEHVISGGYSLSPPIFDDSRLYVAYRRGGVDSPIEGVIASVAKL